MVLARDYLIWSPLASIVTSRGRLKLQQLFLKKVHRHGIPFLTDHGLQGHQTLMAGSLDLNPQNAPYGIVQRIQTWVTWRPNGPGPVLSHIYFIQALVVLALYLGLGSVLL